MPFLAYFAVLLIAVGSVMFSVDLLTSPLPREEPTIHKPTLQKGTNSAPNPVRQIPIGRVTAKSDGERESKPAPVDPARPDPVLQNAARDAENLAAVARPAANVNAANKQPEAEPPQPEQAQAEQPKTEQPEATEPAAPAPRPALSADVRPEGRRHDSCNIAGCASAYKSFRAADCTYQPYDGPRKLCENPPAPRERVAASSRLRGLEAVTRIRRDDERDDVVREVKQLTERDIVDDGGRRRGLIIFEAPDDEEIPRPPLPVGR